MGIKQGKLVGGAKQKSSGETFGGSIDCGHLSSDSREATLAHHVVA
jgi:hypothetical protein